MYVTEDKAQPGVVEAITIFPERRLANSAAMLALIEKYGKPTRTWNQTLQNAFGATFLVPYAVWRTPLVEVVFVGHGVQSIQPTITVRSIYAVQREEDARRHERAGKPKM